MATHYVYDDPDKTQLAQGDVLMRTPALTAVLNQYHPHYAQHRDYNFFTIVTQSCDLVRRNGKPPKTPYIAIAAARTLEETLIREAAKGQEPWQREAKVIGSKLRSNLLEFLKRLFNNNEPGYFYLHVDQQLGIHRSCCVVLALSVALRAEHYDTLLEAKVAQLKDTFQAKLGWLIGNMYSRVGTTEWDKEYPDNPVKAAAKKILGDTLYSVTDEQIKEGLAELKEANQIDGKSPTDIFEHIRDKNILPRSKKFEQRAMEVSKAIRLVNLIQAHTKRAMHDGDVLRNAITQILAAASISNEMIGSLADTLIATVDTHLCEIMTDDHLPDRDEVVLSFIRGILQDPKIATILR